MIENGIVGQGNQIRAVIIKVDLVGKQIVRGRIKKQAAGKTPQPVRF